MAEVLIRKSEDKRLVWGEVYAPNRPDVDGEFMTADAIEEMAYDFMRKVRLQKVDTQHDNKLVPGCTVVESFIARKGDPNFIEGAWVVCVHVDDDSTWEKVKKGEINGFSVEAMVFKEDAEVEIEIPDIISGATSQEADHSHTFQARYGTDGKFGGGFTNTVNGHYHRIAAGTITEEAAGHRHRFSAVDDILVVPAGK